VGAIVARGTAAPGPGLDPDALSYVGAAESLARAGTYRVPASNWTAVDSTEALAHFPPGFSTAIAIPVAAGLAPQQAARLVVVVCAAMGAAILFTTVASAVGIVWAALAVVCVFATPAVLSQHLSLLSEPMYFVTVLLVIAGMTALRVRPRPRTALLTGLAASAAVMTRYAGAAVLIVAVLWALAIPGPFRQRIIRALLVAAPSAALCGWWVIRTMRQAGPRGIRTFSVYGGLWPGLAEGAATIRDTVVPGTGGFAWRSVTAVVGVFGLACLVWKAAHRLERVPDQAGNARARALLAATGWTAAGSAALVVVAKVIADPGIPADERMLSPLIVLAELAVMVSVATSWRTWNLGVRSAVAVVFGAWLAASVAWSANRVASAMAEGNDLASVEWRESPTIAWVRTAGAGRVLFTNWPAPLYFHAHRATHTLPEVLDALTLHRFRDRLERQHGVVVAFNAPSVDVASPDLLAARLQLRVVARLSDGVIWEVTTTGEKRGSTSAEPVADRPTR